jgi:RHS repeat-associated protein
VKDQFDGTAWTYQLSDGLGSVRQLADGQGYVVQRYDYGPFGETLKVEGRKSNTLRYTGEQTDIDTGLVYLRARWYDPTTGRFTTRDPFPGLASLPQSQHPYVYTHNNPVNHTDPTGEFIDTLLDAVSLGMSLETVINDLRTGCGNLGEDLLWLGADVVGFLLPVIPALGTVRRVATHIDDLGDVKRILVVGESSFDYSTSLYQTLKGKGRYDITATSLQALKQLPPSKPGFRAFDRVNARLLHVDPRLAGQKFNAIIFNNPFTGKAGTKSAGKQTAHLIEDFIESGRGVLAKSGEIHVNVTRSVVESYPEVASVLERTERIGLFGQTQYSTFAP